MSWGQPPGRVLGTAPGPANGVPSRFSTDRAVGTGHVPGAAPASWPLRPRGHYRPGVIEAVVFDLDGVILDSEQVWDSAREALAKERGGRWHENAQRDMMGMSSVEWSRYMHDVIGLPESPEEINAEVVSRLEAIYREELPLIPGAVEAVERLAATWPLGLASSSNRRIIDLVLELSGLKRFFGVTVSSEEVERGKPAPNVYLEAARRLAVPADRCVAVEDSENGIRSAKAAGMRVVAVPNARYRPSAEALAEADGVLERITELDVTTIAG
jgi:HAD superfamily hydrolase (TIGR01509 family)